MTELALKYYMEGYNCSQCILKAFDEKYDAALSNQLMDMCSAIYGGFGIGSICSVLLSGIMIFGFLFDERTASLLRTEFLGKVQDTYGSLLCPRLRGEKDCGKLIAGLAEIIETMICEHGGVPERL